jgi:signal transduction histidine kinase
MRILGDVMLNTIRRSLSAKFLILFSIMLIAAGINLMHFLYFENLKQPDDYTLNIAGKQRLLTMQMQACALSIAQGNDVERKTLEDKINEYDSALQAFTNGYMLNGEQLTEPTEEIRVYVNKNNEIWYEFKQKAYVIATTQNSDPEFQDALKYINENTGTLVTINDNIMQGYLKLAESKWELANQMTALFVGVNIVVFTFAFIYTGRFTKPLKVLRDTMDNIGKGEDNIKAKVLTNDEIGILAKSFNSMLDTIHTRTKELELKNKISEKVNAHISELVKKESESNQRLQLLTAKLKEQAEKLREVDVAKEEFASMITHELKTPLVPIQGYCELLLDGTLGELTQEQKEKTQIIYDSALSLLQLIQDVLDVHKLELGKMNLSVCDVTAKELIDRSIKRFKPIAETKNIELVDGTEPEIMMKCDPERILQVINNLVSNAVKFVSDQNGRIKVSARSENGSIVFVVEDNGIGIPKEKQQNLFKKFYQVDASLRRSTGGTGLGLAICKGIVEAHNGKIWVDSDEGRGTKFYFSIPIGGMN